MARNRRKKTSGHRRGTPAWMWLLTGILIGLGLAWYLFAMGYIPEARMSQPIAGETATRQFDVRLKRV